MRASATARDAVGKWRDLSGHRSQLDKTQVMKCTSSPAVKSRWRIRVLNTAFFWAAIRSMSAFAQDLSSSKSGASADIAAHPQFPVANPAVKVHGAIEVHGVRNVIQPGPSDLFSDLAFQTLNKSGGASARKRYVRAGRACAADSPISALRLKKQG